MVDLARLTRAELSAMADAGQEMLDWQRVLAKTGDSILGHALAGGELEDWTHYPPGDVYDPQTHAQYFYHRHVEGDRSREHGHFHAFLRPRGMAAGTRPMMMPELAIADAPAQPSAPVFPPVPQPNQGHDNDKLSHLVAIGMDATGAPVRLFTTNRWVTGETWYAAGDVARMLDRFSVEIARPSWPLNRWLSALFRLYWADMAELLLARDELVMSWRRRHRGKVHVLEDRRIEITSMAEIDVADRMRRLTRMLEKVA